MSERMTTAVELHTAAVLNVIAKLFSTTIREELKDRPEVPPVHPNMCPRIVHEALRITALHATVSDFSPLPVATPGGISMSHHSILTATDRTVPIANQVFAVPQFRDTDYIKMLSLPPLSVPVFSESYH
ncbi:Uncharacterized protein BM_BM9527 [Brugia malayi]|nr:Uncharacterized protein BM_BM9527 [Brugia malayi]VIO88759.1 Uncharacterized protein BM_BM9527 [Brugia malayi]